MRICKHHYYLQLRHSVRLLIRYQQIGYYFIMIPALLSFPYFMAIKEKYIPVILFAHYLLVIWVFSPFYVHQFSFSYDDQRSLSIFPLNWKALIWSRNTVTILLLLLVMFVSVLTIRLLYLKDSADLFLLFICEIQNILLIITLGNLLVMKTISRRREYFFSWTALLTFPVIIINILFMYFIDLAFHGVEYFLYILISFFIYISFYLYSVETVIKKISYCYCANRKK